MKIDYVIPYVTSDDSAWRQLFEKYFGKNYYDIESVRFDGNMLFKYVFRGIENHMPWINNVFLIVQSESQIPKWINRDTVQIIYHDSFIPSEYLPTFNSCTIECFLHLIPGLSNLFIYGNDDTYILKDVDPSEFFDGVMPKHYLKQSFYNRKYENKHIKMCQGMLRLVGKKLGLSPFPDNFYSVPKHCQQPFNKSILKSIAGAFNTEIKESITRFRNEKNISQYLFILYYMYSTAFKYVSHIPSRSFDMNISLNEIIELPRHNQFKLICLNNNTANNELIMMSSFEKHFPVKSRFEI